MANNSIEIKIGADASDFNKELRKLDKEIRGTERNAKELDKSLQLEFDTGRAVKAQQQYQKALELTEQKAEAIRQQLKHLEDSGKIDTADYEKLQTELIKAETKAVVLKNRLDEVRKVEVEQVAKKFEDIGDKIESAGKKLAPFSAAAAGVLTGMTAIAKKASDLGGEIDEMSERFDISYEAVQRWSYLSMQSGVETNTFSRALIRMRAAMADMVAGTSNKATEILQSLGISPDKFKNAEDMFDGIMDALRAVEDTTLQTAYANEIFGDKIANDMLPYIRIAEETLAQYNAEFDAMATLNAEQVKSLDHLSDSFTRFKTSMEYAAAQMGAAFAPIMERVLKLVEEKVVPAIQKLADWFSGLNPASQDAILGLLGIISAAAPLLILFGKISTGVGGMIKLFSNLNKQALITAGGVAALGGALMLGLNLIGDWKQMSTVEKILKSLTLAALVAAGAVAVFHASWSLGLAIGAIAAGIVAAIGAVKAAEKDLTGETTASDYVSSASKGVINAAPTDQDLADMDEWTRTAAKHSGSGGGQTIISNQADNSTNTFHIYIEANEYASAEEIVDIVSKRIATLAQARR